ncbi:retinol dehydrogenase 12-like isoform X1 [Panulirus ornatus]|uniref:retinol dehydrogenase 12-like isoform X1 n=2 Tax=Panulirus ornatus TaxID=150431 RepID=UPI003A873F51
MRESFRMWGTVLGVIAFVVFALIVMMLVFGHIYRLRAGFTTFSANMIGKTVIITGASAGIGKEAARDLACRGARVILACRNLKKASDVADEIRSSSGNNLVLVRMLDTSSLASVRTFAAKILAEEERLDVLILNAGRGTTNKKTMTSDGFELTMATNHFGHFLLANLLLGLLKESSPSRVVVTASMAHNSLKKLDPKALNYENGNYQAFHAYSQSKACNILFARHLAELMKETGVVVNALCPGLVATDIFQKSNTILFSIINHIVPFLGKTAQQGAQTIIHLAVSEEAATITGEFFEDCKVSKEASPLVCDTGLAKKVWEASEMYVDLKPEETHF